MKTYLFNVLYALSMLLNAIANGARFETISARAYRMRLANQPYWWWLSDAIDFGLGENHCKEAFEKEHK